MVRRSASRVARHVLERLDGREARLVLDALIERHPTLRGEAEEVAKDILVAPATSDVALAVRRAVAEVDWDAINRKAGRQPWGYVEPSEAAWELLGGAVDGFVADMKRRQLLGLSAAAETLCLGIVVGLHDTEEQSATEILQYAPDFPLEEACHAVSELLRACSPGSRAPAARRLSAEFQTAMPDWSKPLARTIRKLTKKR